MEQNLKLAQALEKWYRITYPVDPNIFPPDCRQVHGLRAGTSSWGLLVGVVQAYTDENVDTASLRAIVSRRLDALGHPALDRDPMVRHDAEIDASIGIGPRERRKKNKGERESPGVTPTSLNKSLSQAWRFGGRRMAV